MMHGNFEILPEKFIRTRDPRFDVYISKVLVKNPGMNLVFAFAVDQASVNKFNLDLDKLQEFAIGVVERKIKKGLFEHHELTYEYKHPSFIRLEDPVWWKKS